MKISQPQNIDFNSISTLIFDWGGVITNLLPERSIDAFRKLGLNNSKQYFNSIQTNPHFLMLEEGKIKPEAFYDVINKEIGTAVDYQKLNKALCAMLGDTPKVHIQILRKLQSRFRLFLLSNTSIVHTNYYIPYLKETQNIHFRDLFSKTYFSYDVGIRKPHKIIFEKVIDDNKLDVKSTLFLDDTEQNIEAAHKLGIRCFHVKAEYPMEKIFNELLIS